MAVKLRLMRMGKKKQPTYRVVVADSRSPRDGRFIELIGRYDPRQEPSLVEIDNERAVDWLNKGAQPTPPVRKLLEISGAWTEFKVGRGEIHTITPPAAAAEEKPPAAPAVAEHTPEIHVVGGGPEGEAEAGPADDPADDAAAEGGTDEEGGVLSDVAGVAAAAGSVVAGVASAAGDAVAGAVEGVKEMVTGDDDAGEAGEAEQTSEEQA